MTFFLVFSLYKGRCETGERRGTARMGVVVPSKTGTKFCGNYKNCILVEKFTVFVSR